MRTGKRCPNQAEPGLRYCSIHVDYVAPAPAAEEPQPAAPEAAEAPDAPAGEAAEAGAE